MRDPAQLDGGALEAVGDQWEHLPQLVDEDVQLLGVVVVQAPLQPVAQQLRAYHRGQELDVGPWLLITGGAVVAILIAATILPLRLSARRLEQMELVSGGVE